MVASAVVADPRTPPIPVGPTGERDRLPGPDVLRGFALLGILLANVHIISGATRVGPAGAADSIVQMVAALLVDNSFLPLFSFLFGLGLTLQLHRTRHGEQPFVRIYVRRLLGLFLIAIAHWLLVWDASILINYAVLGFPLLLFRNRSSRLILMIAGLCLLMQVLASPLSERADAVLRQFTPSATLMERQSTARLEQSSTWAALGRQRLSSGSYREAVLERSERFRRTFSRPQRYYPWLYGSMFAMLLLGLWAGRTRLLHGDGAAGARLLSQVLWGGILLGVSAKLAALSIREIVTPAWGSATHLAAGGLQRLGGPLLGFGYAAGLLLALRSGAAHRALQSLAAVGRMALTNYVLQSVFATAIFYGHGVGLYGRVGFTEGLMIALGIFLLQLPLSAWWLSRFRFGPLEWVWRSATYGRWQPMRRASVPDTGWRAGGALP